MPAAFRELFESFMNVCISLLILSLFAWQALASLRESLGGGPVRKWAYQGSQRIFAAVSRCEMYLNIYIIIFTYLEPNWPSFYLGKGSSFLEGSNPIAVTNDFQVVGKNLVVRTGVAFGSGNQGLHQQTPKLGFWIPKKGSWMEDDFPFPSEDDFQVPCFFFLAGKRCDTITSSFSIWSCAAFQVVVPPFSVLYWMTMTVYRWPARDLRRLEGWEEERRSSCGEIENEKMLRIRLEYVVFN